MSTRSTSMRTLVAGLAATALLGGCALTDGPAGGVTPTTASTPAPSTHDEAATTTDDTDTATPTEEATTEAPTADDTVSPTGTGAAGPGDDGEGGGDDGAGATGTAGGIDPATVDLSELTIAWPCGYGFELSNEEGTASLVIEWVRPGTRIPPVTISLPDRRWEGRLHLGEGLGAVSCTPGTEPPGVVETWPVVAGILRFQDSGAEPGSQVRAELNGVTVGAPDGTKLALPNQVVTNQGWGITYDR